MQVKNIEKIVILLLSSLLLIQCQRSSSPRRIRLSDAQTATRTEDQVTTTIHLEPSKQRSIAVMIFQNKTGDNSLEWLKQGLTEMFIRTLSQSRDISVLGQDRMVEIMNRLEESDASSVDMNMAAVVAREANVEVLVSGHITKEGDSLRLNVQLMEPKQGQIIREESVDGHGLETIFSMVDHISQKIKSDLQLSFEVEESPGKSIAELTTNSLEAWRQYTAGEEKCNQVLMSEAIPYFERAIELDQTFISAYVRLAGCYLNEGENESAFELYNKVSLMLSEAEPQEAYRIEILGAMLKNDFHKLITLHENWLEQSPKDVEAAFDLGNIYFNMQDYKKAITYYQHSLDLDPKYKMTYNQLGYSYANYGKFDKAIKILEKYLEIASDEPNPFDSIGEIYLYQGEYGKASRQFKKAVEVNENFTASWEHLASTERDRGNYKKAVQYYHKVLEQTDGIRYNNNLSAMALLEWRMGHTDKAIELYKTSLKHNPLQYNSLRNLHVIFSERGDTLAARQLLENHYETLVQSELKSGKNDPNIQIFIALSLMYNVFPDRSLAILEESITDDQPPAIQLRNQFQRSLLMIKMGRYADAVDVWGGQNPHDDFFKQFGDVKNLGYNAVWQLYGVFNLLYRMHPEEGIANYQAFAAKARETDSSIFETGFRGLMSDLYLMQDDHENAAKQLQMMGMPFESQWHIIGPFDNKDGFRRKYPPEKEVDLDRVYRQGKREIVWKKSEDDIHDGYVNLKEQIKDNRWAVAYATINIKSPDSRTVQLRFGMNESHKVWLNGEEVWRFNRIQDALIDDTVLAVDLKPGLNEVLVKFCNLGGEWGFYFRVTDETGYGIPEVRFVAADEAGEETT